MNRKITLLFVFLLIGGIAFAQNRSIGHLTIFSEDGDKFFLILNGEKQNDIAQTNLRIEELNQPYYNAKIQFEDKTLIEISKNNLAIADFEGVYQDVTYKIKKDKNNKSKMKLNFFSMIPVEPNYVAPRNVHVVHYGQAAGHDGYSQTTTTTRSDQGINIGVNVNSTVIGMNMNVNDSENRAVSEPSSTHTTSGEVSRTKERRRVGCEGRNMMGSKNFASALANIKGQGFDETRLKVAKQIVSVNCFSADQIVQFCQAFGFEQSKLEFAKYAYDSCTEPRNYFKVNPVFGFSSSVEELTEYIQSRN